MSKKKFTVPLVFLSVAANGTGGGYSEFNEQGIRPLPMSFDEWAQSRFCADYDWNGEVDFDDYARWWCQSGFSTDAFTEYTGKAWKDEWSF